MTSHLTPSLSPYGQLTLVTDDLAPPLDDTIATRLVAAFDRGSGAGLLHLGGAEVGTTLSPTLAYWREFASGYVSAMCVRPDATARDARLPPPSPSELETTLLGAPPMPGAEYISVDTLTQLWNAIGDAFAALLAEHENSVEAALKSLDPAWNVVGRVHFNVAENRRDADAPFMFLATYTHALSSRGKAQHLPLGEAFQEYAGARNREALKALLVPVQRASAELPWLNEMLERREIYEPVPWTPVEAYQLLNDVPALERAGVIVRLPAGWTERAPRPLVSVTVGARKPGGVGVEAIMDFQMDETLDGERLTPAELKSLLAGPRRLALLRGRWIEVDADRLRDTMTRFDAARALADSDELTFAKAMRLVAGASVAGESVPAAESVAWSKVVAGPWLAELLAELRSPENAEAVDPGRDLLGTLRPYQDAGVRWLHLLSSLGLGACLADDMGLGKTIQVLALLLSRRREQSRRRRDHRPSLLVVPASLVGNWQAEIARFAPSLRVTIAHPSAMPPAEFRVLDAATVADADLVVTTYGTVARVDWMSTLAWDLVIIDEAQAIKNPGARQTRAVKSLSGRARVALTGTPVENHLSDLWSIFDFINPGLLGSAKQFSTYSKALAKREHNPYGPLRELVRPYILRRLKTDRSVIADLPAKTELQAFCALSRVQIAMYRDAVDEMMERLAKADGIKRRGIALTYLMRLKQICNHPSHWLGDGAWRPSESGKFARLAELAETIAAKQEKVLVFTQFREAVDPLASFLATTFGRPGITLSGATAVKERTTLVKRFQEDERIPFFVLSLKAGGSGLNLTAASHVIHFDRWWNPAVENQATDRAFRIGQRKNVLVHKFICRGTIEERIDQMIAAKASLSAELLTGGAEIPLSEMSDAELLKLVALDVTTAAGAME